MMLNKKGEMGVGTLIVFIAMLLVAAVAAGVLIQTAGSLQEKSLATGQQARAQISTNARAIEVSAKDGLDSRLDDFSIIYKLSPGSDPIKLDQVLYSESTKDTTNSLRIRENALGINDVFTGYFTATSYAYPEKTDAFEDSVPQEFWNRFSATQTSEMMIGKIAVAIVFVESDGAVDTNFENWTRAEQDYMINATVNALNWWSSVEPRAHIRHTFEIYRDVPISYEPITRDTSAANQTLWITEALDYIGAPSGATIFDRTRTFDDELRKRKNANWGFTLFIVDSSHTPGGFADGYAGIAYINGPHTFVASNAFANYPEVMLAHEFGHIFGADDEYFYSGCNCTDKSGYFSIESQNCDAIGNTCLTNTTSIMRNGMESVTAYQDKMVDVFALAQMGLIDSNYNNYLDPVDILFDTPDKANMTQETINSLVNDYYNPTETRNIGFFANEYLQEGTNHRDNNLQRGDIVKFEYESARPIREDESIRLTFIPKIGTGTLTEFVTPDVISMERVYLYP